MDNKVPDILEKICKEKQKEVDFILGSGMEPAYMDKALRNPSTRSFHDAITKPCGDNLMHIITELKKASPSAGEIRPGAEPVDITQLYEFCGASAISLLTEANFFKGSIDYLRMAREAVNIPLLRKDFIIHPVQIYEACVYGADAILLIAAKLEVSEMKDYIAIADSLNMDCLVESHNMYELEKAIAAEAKIFGINNRNLHNFEVNLETTMELAPHIPKGKPLVTESGIYTREHVEYLSTSGAKAMLVGGSLMDIEANPTLDDIQNQIYRLLGK